MDTKKEIKLEITPLEERIAPTIFSADAGAFIWGDSNCLPSGESGCFIWGENDAFIWTD